MKRIFLFLSLAAELAMHPRASAQNSLKSAASLGIVGSTADVSAPTRGGIVLVGGGGNVNSAFQWMIERSGGGDVVVITASGTTAYNEEIMALGKVNSVETLNITSRELADNDTVATIIRNAEMLFIGGGDQSKYMRFWKGTKTQAAINYLLNEKKVPVGGTSAGCAILSGIYYSGENDSVVSGEALADPYNKKITLYNDDLIHAPYLQQVVTDQHYLTRKREGRHVVFLSRIIKDWNIFARGIAPDERTAVCIDENGQATVKGEGRAYFLITDKNMGPENVTAGQPLNWVRNDKALKVYELAADANGSFSVADFDTSKAKGGKWYAWYVDKGTLHKTESLNGKGDNK